MLEWAEAIGDGLLHASDAVASAAHAAVAKLMGRVLQPSGEPGAAMFLHDQIGRGLAVRIVTVLTPVLRRARHLSHLDQVISPA